MKSITFELSTLMRRVMEAIIDPVTTCDVLCVNMAEMRLYATGLVRAERFEAACPTWVQRVSGQIGPYYECNVAMPYEDVEYFRGEITDLLDMLLRGVLEQFVAVGRVRVTFWEVPNERRLNFRFTVYGVRK